MSEPQYEAVMEIGCPHGAWGITYPCPHCGTPRSLSPSQHVSDRFLAEVERGEREWPERETAVSAGAETEPTPIQRLESTLKYHATTDGEVVSLMNMLGNALHQARHQTCACAAQGELPQALDAIRRLIDTASLIRGENGRYYTVGFAELNEVAEMLPKPCPRLRHDEHCADLHWTDDR